MDYIIEGETLDGNYIQFEFSGTWGEVKEACQNLLFNYEGGHLDIFSSETGEFIDDIEV